VVTREGKQRHIPGTPQGAGKVALMRGAYTTPAARLNFGPFRNVPAQPGHVFEVNLFNMIHTKATDLSAWKKFSAIPASPGRARTGIISSQSSHSQDIHYRNHLTKMLLRLTSEGQIIRG
jgi:hypothetical protein